jgi:hypothetical protein
MVGFPSEGITLFNNDLYTFIDIFDKLAATKLFQGRKYIKYFVIVILLLLLIEIY